MKKIGLIFITLVTCIFTFNVKALDLSSLNLSSKYAVMYNLNDNSIVYDLNKDDKTSIASLTKIMTCLVAIENIDDMNKTVTITSDMIKGLVEQNAYVIGLKVGQTVTYKDLLYGTFLPSGADAASALAISLVGSTDKYVTLMNAKAKSLNLEELHFANVVGLDDDNNYGTVNGVAKLLIEALKNDTFKEMFLTNQYTLSDNSMTVTSSLVHGGATYKLDVSYILGGKTGYTDKAGKCLASVAKDKTNNIEYLLVTTNASTAKDNAYHILDATKIYNYFFKHYKYYSLLEDDTLVSIPVKYVGKSYDIKVTNPITYYSDDSFDISNVTTKYTAISSLTPFSKVGSKIGEVTFYYDGNEIKTVDVVLNEKVPYYIIDIIRYNIALSVTIFLSFILILLLIIKHRYKSVRN